MAEPARLPRTYVPDLDLDAMPRWTVHLYTNPLDPDIVRRSDDRALFVEPTFEGYAPAVPVWEHRMIFVDDEPFEEACEAEVVFERARAGISPDAQKVRGVFVLNASGAVLLAAPFDDPWEVWPWSRAVPLSVWRDQLNFAHVEATGEAKVEKRPHTSPPTTEV